MVVFRVLVLCSALVVCNLLMLFLFSWCSGNTGAEGRGSSSSDWCWLLSDGAKAKRCCLAHWCYVAAAAVTVAAITFWGLSMFKTLRIACTHVHRFSFSCFSKEAADKDFFEVLSRLDVQEVHELCAMACVALQRDGGPSNLMLRQKEPWIQWILKGGMIKCPELYTASISPWCRDMRGSCSILLYWRIRFILRQYTTIFRCLILKLKDDAHQEPHTFCLAAFSLSACPTAARASCKTLFFTVPTIRSEYSSLEQSSTWSYPQCICVQKRGFRICIHETHWQTIITIWKKLCSQW